MKASFSFILAIVAIATSLTMQNPYASAHTIIDEACTKYNVLANNGTQSCIEILGALPGFQSGDKKTLALNSMNLAKEKFIETKTLIKNKIQNKSIIPRVIGAVRTCLRLYQEGNNSFGFGISSFDSQNYDIVDYQWMRGAYYDVFQCERELNMVGFEGDKLGINTIYLVQVVNAAQAAFHHFSSNLT